MREPAVAKAPL